jgi:hypothetical protein
MEDTESKPTEKKPEAKAAAPAKPAATAKPAAATLKAGQAPQPQRTSVPPVPGPKTKSSHAVKASELKGDPLGRRAEEAKKADAQVQTDSERPKEADQARKPDPDFRSLTDLSELIDCYNEMTLTATDLGLRTIPVKSFPSVQTGVQACERLHAQIKSTREGKKEGSKKMAKSTKSKARTAVKGKTAAKKANETGGRTRTKLPPDAKIVWIGKENPAREGSGRHARIELVRRGHGQTVKTFLAKGGRGATLANCVRKYKLAKLEGGAA